VTKVRCCFPRFSVLRARGCQTPTGGWMLKVFLTEEGTLRWFANVYNAREMPTSSYPARTVQNVRESDGTLWFGTTDTPGAKTTLEAYERLHKSVMLVTPNEVVLASDVVAWLCRNPQIKCLNVAGKRSVTFPVPGRQCLGRGGVGRGRRGGLRAGCRGRMVAG
jgi:hypothetical protein